LREPNQAFSAAALRWMPRRRSQGKFAPRSGAYPSTASEWKELLKSIASTVATGAFTFDSLRRVGANGREALTTSCLEEALVLRKINDNLRRAYGMRQAQRTELVETAVKALSETCGKTIYRLDLSSCFESIERRSILRRLSEDGCISTQTLSLLEQLFESAADRGFTRGVPRGLLVSSSLAELELRGLERRIRRVGGVYLVLRYVDDMLVFSTADPTSVYDCVNKEIAKSGFAVNARKSPRPIRVGCNCDFSCPHGANCPCGEICKCFKSDPHTDASVEFLGYGLHFPQRNSRKKNKITILLSRRKVSKVKTRIFLAFHAFSKDNDALLLLRRMRFLADNVSLPSKSPGRNGLLSGLAFTHELCEIGPSVSKHSQAIEELDRFYRTNLRRHFGSTPPLKKFSQVSFTRSFEQKISVKFTGAQVNQIRRCWRGL
jgi:hypothetical protein